MSRVSIAATIFCAILFGGMFPPLIWLAVLWVIGVIIWNVFASGSGK